MTGEFPPSGAGLPSVDQVMLTREYLLRHNRKASTRFLHAELLANGFDIGSATVGRYLKGKIPKPEKPDTPDKARKRAKALIRDSAAGTPPPPPPPKANELTPEELLTLASIIGDLKSPDSLKKNCDIALLENKVRMALNIILMQRMIGRGELLLLDMRGTAALIDALTASSKLSGGASFEVIAPGDVHAANGHGNGDGRPMKDITPPTAEVASIEDFRRYRDSTRDGKGT